MVKTTYNQPLSLTRVPCAACNKQPKHVQGWSRDRAHTSPLKSSKDGPYPHAAGKTSLPLLQLLLCTKDKWSSVYWLSMQKSNYHKMSVCCYRTRTFVTCSKKSANGPCAFSDSPTRALNIPLTKYRRNVSVLVFGFSALHQRQQ